MATQIGFERNTSLSTAQSLTVPAGTDFALVTTETQSARWRADGTDPTSSVGFPLDVGSVLNVERGLVDEITFIEKSASAVLIVAYFSGPY